MKREVSVPGICFDRVIPPQYQPARAMAYRATLSHYISAIQTKASGNGSKKLHFGQHIGKIGDLKTLSATHPISVARMAVINLKKWDNGHTLRCRFLDGSKTQQTKVKGQAQIWEDYANLKISFVDAEDAEIRISFQADPGSWSAIGTDCLVASYFPQYQPTMNFGWLRDDTDDGEYERVVVHEFGHALGCIHEHQSPTEKLKWNKQAVYKTFSGPPNYWSKADIDSNILEKYSPKGISATAFDIKSIMLYQFDGSLFTDHKGTPSNTHLSQRDEEMITQMYPKNAS